MLAPVRASLCNDRPVHWQKVNNLPGLCLLRSLHSYREGHRLHDLPWRHREMPLTRQAAPLTMEWCLSCHRNPGTIPASARRDLLRRAVAAQADPARRSAATAGRLSDQYRSSDGLLDMPPLTDPRAPGVLPRSARARCSFWHRRPPRWPPARGRRRHRALCEHARAARARRAAAVSRRLCRFRAMAAASSASRHEAVRPSSRATPAIPASLGGTDVFMEADILDLYDPARSRTLRGPLPVESWDSFFTLPSRPPPPRREATRQLRLRLLTGRVTSPTVLRRIDGSARALPQGALASLRGAQRRQRDARPASAFGKPLARSTAHRRRCRVLSIGADPLGPGPRSAAHVAPVAARQRPGRRSPKCSAFTRPKASGL